MPEYRRSTVRAALFLIALLLSAECVAAQQSDCADCHFSNPGAPGHLYEWDRSPHGLNHVGCEKCHGGDATTFEPFPAHRGILNSRNPASPVNWRNIPKTCGSCHSSPFVAFQKSKHFALLQQGNADVPVCTTCHSDVAGQMLSPSALEARCAKCHRQGGVGGHPGFPETAKAVLETIHEVRSFLDEAKPLIRRVKDAQLRRRLEVAYQQAEVPLTESVNFAHSFSFDASEERQGVARRRAEALLDQLANPGKP